VAAFLNKVDGRVTAASGENEKKIPHTHSPHKKAESQIGG